MSLSPEEQYHQNIFDNDKNEDVYEKKQNKSQPIRSNIKYTRCKILMKQNSQLNKKVINYCKENLFVLNKNNIIFEWIAVYEEEIEYYEEQGIEKFPVLIINNDNITGVTNIIKSLDSIMESLIQTNKKNQKESKPQSKKETDEEMHDFLLRELQSKNADKDDDDQDSLSTTINQRVSSMNQLRKDNGQHSMKNSKLVGKSKQQEDEDEDDEPVFLKSVPKQPLTTSELIKATTKGDDEDKMMSQFWQNQEETII